ncbi:MliC family protein [Aggregatibacter actinomycetemcomitans]|uniref:MliC family protein n=1 Tax=Aggregatibacter actinomycetemcomitans TaxID=714 RepID=UPI00197C9ECE|nr:MliC family protein [Aggregatibacter actinomycetemcomitans]MBN6063135.1 MliC family protein [Aggregatibacter actinomycetemcomitans]MBN6080611.1 MliC family protein [Aggregatibacter actinomycetemcomitans]MBN6083030.1 MliC family protein [Aggregatibacter actinomycetemcomitans]
MLRASFVLLTLMGLTACMVKSVEQKAPAKPLTQVLQKATQKGSAQAYLCKDNKTVRVVRHTTKNKKKLNSISVTFNNVTHRLTPTIAESGRNYSNIHWLWLERKEFSLLKSSVGEILAEQCVAQ